MNCFSLLLVCLWVYGFVPSIRLKLTFEVIARKCLAMLWYFVHSNLSVVVSAIEYIRANAVPDGDAASAEPV